MPATSFRAALSALVVSAGLISAGLAASAGPALAQSPPTFQEYPLRDRVFGPGGAVFPDYVTPYDSGIAYLTGGGGKGALFAAGTADFNCQQTQVPTIRVLSAPAEGRVLINYGTFTAKAIDGGATTRCLGRPVKGLVVSYRGKAAPGAKIALRVTYPTRGAWYDHVVPVSPR